jgi:hypothetical protein
MDPIRTSTLEVELGTNGLIISFAIEIHRFRVQSFSLEAHLNVLLVSVNGHCRLLVVPFVFLAAQQLNTAAAVN